MMILLIAIRRDTVNAMTGMILVSGGSLGECLKKSGML